MPANLSPEFERADRRFREAHTDAERIAALIEMLSTIPKHKGTEKMQADMNCLVVDAAGSVPDQIESSLAQLHERGLVLRSVPRNVIDPQESNQRSGLVVVNKIDAARAEDVQAARELYAATIELVPVSAQTGQGLDAWFGRLWDLLAMIRVYAKQPGHPPDPSRPFTLPAGATVAELARHIHRNLPDTMKFARLWGHTRFAGQQDRSAPSAECGENGACSHVCHKVHHRVRRQLDD